MKFWSSILVVIALPTAASAQWSPAELPLPEEAARQLRECGFVDVSIKFDGALQEEVLAITDEKAATDEQLACAARVSSETYYYLDFSSEDLGERYAAALAPIQEAQGRAMMHEWLEKRDLLDKVPSYDRGQPDAVFAGKLEELCGPNAKGALTSEYGPHAIDPAWALRLDRDYKAIGEVMMCLIAAASVSDFAIGIIGNEKIASPIQSEGVKASPSTSTPQPARPPRRYASR